MERLIHDAALPEGVDAASVRNNYLEAIGGRAKAESIRSKRELASGRMQGMSLEIESKKTNQQQSSIAVKMMGNTMQKVVVNKDKAIPKRKDNTFQWERNNSRLLWQKPPSLLNLHLTLQMLV